MRMLPYPRTQMEEYRDSVLYHQAGTQAATQNESSKAAQRKKSLSVLCLQQVSPHTATSGWSDVDMEEHPLQQLATPVGGAERNLSVENDSCDADSLDGDESRTNLSKVCTHDYDINADCEKIITNLNFQTEEELTRMLGETETLSQSNSSLSDSVVNSNSPFVSTQALCDGRRPSDINIPTDVSTTNGDIVNKSSKSLTKANTIPGKKGVPEKLTGNPRRGSSSREISVKGQENKLKFSKKKSPSEGIRLCERKSPLDETHGIRETVTSRMRYEKGHISHETNECDGEDYLTPTQRKEVELRQIRKEVKNLRKELAERIEEIDMLKKNIDKEAAAIIEDKDKKIQAIREEVKSLQEEQEELRHSYEESVKNVSTLELTITSLKETMAIREKKNADIYLEMYKKGQESAKFERNDELERMAVKCDGSSATIRELLEKLMNTEMELAKWQSLRRQESYDTADVPETEADATMRFLKDSFFHYLTDSKESENHLRAMIRIFNFTDPQKKKIANALTERKNRKTSI